MQERHNSSALAMELCLSCIKPSKLLYALHYLIPMRLVPVKFNNILSNNPIFMIWILMPALHWVPTTKIPLFLYVYSVAHCSRSQDIALFKFKLSYHSNPLQDTCPITSAVLGHLIRTRVPLMFLNWDKKSYQLCEKCATLRVLSFLNLNFTFVTKVHYAVMPCGLQEWQVLKFNLHNSMPE